MADVTVAQYADVLKVPVEKLLSQLNEAGIPLSSAEQTISDEAKRELLTHLKRAHGRSDSIEPKKITLKRKRQSELRLSGDRGRQRTVQVEVRRKRTYVQRTVLEEQTRQQQAELDEKRRVEEEKKREEEQAVVAEQQRREEEARAEEEAARQAAAEEQARVAAAEEEARKAAEEAEARRKAEQEFALQQQLKREQETRAREKKTVQQPPRPSTGGRTELHLAQDKRGKRQKKKRAPRRRPVSVNVGTRHGFEQPTKPVVREVAIPETLTVAELAQKMAVKAPEVMKQLIGMGVMVAINQTIDQDTAALVVEEMGHTVKLLKETEPEVEMLPEPEVGEAVARAPVVTVMGHVDHGKTSLLDYIRESRVTAGEAGGITQHIGAYSVETAKGKVTFLDTPGHEAFTAMRARGAEVTDVVILVVAADDGVMPQTVEAVQHAKAAEVPIVVAVNKIDRPEADPDRVRNELAQHEVIPEDWGGDYQFVNVSAKTGEGIDDLLDALLLQAEVLELKAPDEGPATGVVVESSVEKGRGAVATVLVNSGTLHQGDVLLAGREYGRIRAMFDDAGNPIDEAGPATPAVVLGLSGAPAAGDEMRAVENERQAREVAEYRQQKERDSKLAKEQATRLENVFDQMKEEQTGAVNLLIKADVQGSAEALRDAMMKLSGEEVEVKVIASGVGGITASDATLAQASSAIIIGFNVRADAAARASIKESGIDLRYYSVIYEAIDDVKQAISGLLAPEVKEQIVGLAEVREVFRSPKFGNVAGCMVTEGFVRRNLPIRVLRENVVIYQGELESLRRFKDDVNEVRAGTECGIGVRNYNDVKIGDQIECYERIEVARSL